MHPQSRVIRSKDFSGVVCGNFEVWWRVAAQLCGKTPDDSADTFLWIPSDGQIAIAEQAISRYLSGFCQLRFFPIVPVFLPAIRRQYLGITGTSRKGELEPRIWIVLYMAEESEEFTDRPKGWILSRRPWGLRLQYNLHDGSCHSLERS